MKYTIYEDRQLGWMVQVEGDEDDVVDFLEAYCGGDHEQALDLYESAEFYKDSFATISVDLPENRLWTALRLLADTTEAASIHTVRDEL